MKKTTPILLTIIAVLFVATLYLLYLNLNKSPTSVSTPTGVPTEPIEKISPSISVDETANWKTFTASNLSFKYPDSGYSICPEADFLSIFQEKNLDCNGIAYEVPLISFRNYYTEDFSKQTPISNRIININNVQVIINKYQYEITSNGLSIVNIVEIANIPLKEGDVQLYAFGDQNYFKQSEDLFNQILSTIKFN